ncbi:hypothetical protein [Mesorhizobium sp.]|uniref:hypothetical protein n=1 Tax=Mesorhizobium sp. TaxID=1871066 RepID=UPI000FE4A124|nr:hypothetical protein [Mesorhizobium sp.]RWN11758.1 MAG: hypothetical protein EOR87_14660 [Mesorhizobium sp.]RWN19455.1 MAG: hypothetical protein EOR88_09905 [Mesorhizobium sp.]
MDSPDISNLSIGKGILYFTPTGGSERDMGECSAFETTPSGDTLDYFSNRVGIKKKVRSVVTSTSLGIRIVANEITAENLAMALGGDTPASGGSGIKSFNIMRKTEVTGSLRFEGQNDIGNRLDVSLPSVSFKPGGTFNPLSEEWQEIEINGEALAVENTDGTSDFGSVTVNDEANHLA